MKTFLFNALCANNNSQINSFIGHINNLTSIKRDKIVIILEKKSYKRIKSAIKKKDKINFIKIPKFFIFTRFLGENLYLPLFVLLNSQKNIILINFNGTKNLLCFIPQIIYCLNPMPFLTKSLKIPYTEKIKQILLKNHIRLSINISNNRDYYFFDSKYMRNLYYKEFPKMKNINNKICFIPVKNNKKICEAKTFDKNDELKFIAVGLFHEYKNMHLVINSFTNLLNYYPNSLLVIVAKVTDNDYYNKTMKLISPSIKNKLKIYTNNISNNLLNKFYKDSFLYLSASSCESFGLPAIEAQCFGTPAIVSPNTAAEEIVGEGGLISDYNNENNLTLIVKNLINNPSIYSKKQF